MSTATQVLPKYVKYKTIVTAESSSYYIAPNGVSNKGEGNPGGQRISNPGEGNIPNTATISEYDDNLKTFRQRSLRYIKGCPTLYVDEQVKMGYTLKHEFSFADTIKLTRGELVIFPEETPTLYEYLEKVPYNKDSKFRSATSTTLFYRDNAQKAASELNEERKLRVKAMNIVSELEHDTTKLTKVAAILQLDMNKETEVLINELGVRAEHTPQLIIDAFGEDQGDVAEMVFHAIEKNIIDYDGFKWNFSQAAPDEGKILGMQGRQDEGTARAKLIKYLQSQKGELHRVTIQKMVREHNI